MHQNEPDKELEKRLARYDRLIEEGKIPSASKVIPVEKSIEGKEWILPTQQVIDVLNKAKSVALAECVCRTTYKRCDNPVEVCLWLNDYADKGIKKGDAKPITIPEARKRIDEANQHGLVHLTFNSPDDYVYALCSCCSCCCHDLQIMTKYDRGDVIARADYVAITNDDECVHCGDCVDRCVFGARSMVDGELVFQTSKCYGCGLCVSTCPTEATVMELNQDTE